MDWLIRFFIQIFSVIEFILGNHSFHTNFFDVPKKQVYVEQASPCELVARNEIPTIIEVDMFVLICYFQSFRSDLSCYWKLVFTLIIVFIVLCNQCPLTLAAYNNLQVYIWEEIHVDSKRMNSFSRLTVSDRLKRNYCLRNYQGNYWSYVIISQLGSTRNWNCKNYYLIFQQDNEYESHCLEL